MRAAVVQIVVERTEGGMRVYGKDGDVKLGLAAREEEEREITLPSHFPTGCL